MARLASAPFRKMLSTSALTLVAAASEVGVAVNM
jgi:hypothetical protein